MAQYREILNAITELDKKVDNIRDEMLLNREDIRFVKEIRKITTVEQYRNRIEKFDNIIEIKNKLIGAMVVAQFVCGIIVWYVNKLWS